MSIQEDEAPVIEEATGDLALDLERLATLKRQKANIEEEITYLQTHLMNEFDSTVAFGEGDYRMKATVVRSESFDVDLNKLKDLDPAMYSKVTKLVLDSTAFKRVVSAGAITPAIAQQVVAIKPKAAYIKLTKYTEEETSE